MAFKINDKEDEYSYIFCYTSTSQHETLRITITPQQVDDSVMAGVSLDKIRVKKLIKELKKWLSNDCKKS